MDFRYSLEVQKLKHITFVLKKEIPLVDGFIFGLCNYFFLRATFCEAHGKYLAMTQAYL